jgi:hypothetical protein
MASKRNKKKQENCNLEEGQEKFGEDYNRYLKALDILIPPKEPANTRIFPKLSGVRLNMKANQEWIKHQVLVKGDIFNESLSKKK